jgi:hypothetical protein
MDEDMFDCNEDSLKMNEDNFLEENLSIPLSSTVNPSRSKGVKDLEELRIEPSLLLHLLSQRGKDSEGLRESVTATSI